MIQGLGPIKQPKNISIGDCLAWVTKDPHWVRAVVIGENLDFLRRNASNYGRFVVIVIIVSTLFQFSPLLCCVGLFPAAFWMQCTMNHALGRLLASDPSLGNEGP